MILGRRLEGGRHPSASGAPAKLGAHNSGTWLQQPDHQSFSSGIPNRITVAFSVDAFRTSLSRRIAQRSRRSDKQIAGCLTQVKSNRACGARSKHRVPVIAWISAFSVAGGTAEPGNQHPVDAVATGNLCAPPQTNPAPEVSQSCGRPESRPRFSHRIRCAEEPCVNASGATWPLICC